MIERLNSLNFFFFLADKAQMHTLFSIVSSRRQLVPGPVATPTPLNRASISCNFLIGRYLAFADSAFAQPCYRADSNSILMSTGTHWSLPPRIEAMTMYAARWNIIRKGLNAYEEKGKKIKKKQCVSDHSYQLCLTFKFPLADTPSPLLALPPPRSLKSALFIHLHGLRF